MSTWREKSTNGDILPLMGITSGTIRLWHSILVHFTLSVLSCILALFMKRFAPLARRLLVCLRDQYQVELQKLAKS